MNLEILRLMEDLPGKLSLSTTSKVSAPLNWKETEASYI